MKLPNISRRSTAALVTILAVFVLAASSCDGGEGKSNAEQASIDAQRAIADGFSRLQNSQPIPVFGYSAIRQALIDIQTVQANGVATTTAFYLEGVGLVGWCPSQGLPVPSTYQLSNSVQWVEQPGDESTSELYAIDQGEATGVYVGESSGTNTICLDDNGKGFVHYWEGYTSSVSGLIEYDPALRIKLAGDPTYEFGTEG